MVLIVFISFMYVVKYSNYKETRIIADWIDYPRYAGLQIRKNGTFCICHL